MIELEKQLNEIEELKKQEATLREFLESDAQPHYNTEASENKMHLLEIECFESLEEIKEQKRVAKRNANYWFDYVDGLYDRMRAIRRAYDLDKAAAKMLQLGEDLENYYAEDDGWENLY